MDEMESPRTLPHSVEAEKSVLGGMMLSRDAAEYACEMLKGEDFYMPANQDIFAAMVDLVNHGGAVDSVTLIDALERAGKLNAAGGIAYITELSLFVPSAANIAQYATIVEDRSVLRQLIRAGGDISRDAFLGEQPVDKLLDNAERRIFNISMKKSEETLVHIEEVALSTYFKIGDLIKMQGRCSGVETGFRKLDNVTSGLQSGNLVIVAGRPSMGKTSFALNIAQHAASKAGKVVCIFNLEMSREELAKRILCSQAGVDMHKVNTGRTTDEDLIELSAALDEISSSNIYLDDTGGVTVADIRSRCRKLKTRVGLDLVIIDYLQLMDIGDSRDGRVADIGKVTRALKILARELDVPIMLLSQLSRAVESRTANEYRPVMADLRESGAIEQDADLIMLLYRRAVYADRLGIEPDGDNSAEVIIAKHRNGPIGTVTLSWVDKYAKFTDREERYD